MRGSGGMKRQGKRTSEERNGFLLNMKEKKKRKTWRRKKTRNGGR